MKQNRFKNKLLFCCVILLVVFTLPFLYFANARHNFNLVKSGKLKDFKIVLDGNRKAIISDPEITAFFSDGLAKFQKESVCPAESFKFGGCMIFVSSILPSSFYFRLGIPYDKSAFFLVYERKIGLCNYRRIPITDSAPPAIHELVNFLADSAYKNKKWENGKLSDIILSETDK